MKKRVCTILILTLIFAAAAVAQNPTYTVEKGDTLYSISRKYNIKIESLKSFNNIEDPATLYPGMKINIPGGYTVKKGDTLYSIARENNTTVDELCSLNSMDREAILKQGQFLHVPFRDDEGQELDDSPAVPPSEPATVPEPPVVAAGETEDDHYWPHSGARTLLTGKLKGIQIAGSPGDDVCSIAGGTVVWAADYGLFKKLVLVEGRNGVVYGYGGNEITNVTVGDYVKPGSVIGVLGGAAEKADVFFFVYKDGKPVDPEKAPRV